VADAKALGKRKCKTSTAASVLIKRFCHQVAQYYVTEEGEQRATLIKETLITKEDLAILSKRATTGRLCLRRGMRCDGYFVTIWRYALSKIEKLIPCFRLIQR